MKTQVNPSSLQQQVVTAHRVQDTPSQVKPKVDQVVKIDKKEKKALAKINI